MAKSDTATVPESAQVPGTTAAEYDYLVIGSGFAGSLIACILQTHGRRVAIVDRSSHPRFAIGESSTPAAGLILSSLADQYNLPWLKPFAKYGTWRQACPGITTGRKRGFSYFQHEPGKPFLPRPGHTNELLAAASSSDELSDTQWFRSEVDEYFFKQACEAGVAPFENSEITSLEKTNSGWIATVSKSGSIRRLSAGFLIDASGAGQVLARHLDIDDDTSQLETCSRAIFAHVTDLPEWSTILERTSPGSTSDHPFKSDHAAQHHLLDEGWMWWLRFDSNITSVGLVISDQATAPAQPLAAESRDSPARDEFFHIINRYPSLHEAFAAVSLITPSDTLIRTCRLQRLSKTIAGNGWAMLPHTAGFIDPLHSTGIAHSLAGVERLSEILLAHSRLTNNPSADVSLQHYSSMIRDELTLIDQLVAGCYDAIAHRSFRKFVAFTMCYFAAATTWERSRLASRIDQRAANTPISNSHRSAMLCSDVPAFRSAVQYLKSRMSHESDKSFEKLCRRTLAPFNHVGLFEPPVPNMYGGTSVPGKSEY